MNKINIDENIKKIHFIGIGGVSMSGLAEVMLREGFLVSGSDSSTNPLILKLKNLGVTIFDNQSHENITSDIDLVVYTAAVKDDNPEIISAKDKGIKIIDRAELLGIIMKKFKYPISVAGTHGKTTTTSMISEILLNIGVNPTISVGGILKCIGGNFHIGDDDYFVVESCEYYNSFLKLYPYVGIILNVEKDHTDYFKNLEEIENSFNAFARNIDSNGHLVINKNIHNFEKIISNVKCNIVTFGNSDADFFVSDLNYNENGKPCFNINFEDQVLENVHLSMPGEHNIQNALASLAAMHSLGFSLKDTAMHLKDFNAPNRRFQFKGEFNEIKVIDDYAHHPTEIQETLSAVKKQPHSKIYCVFQPHTYTRTIALLDEFANSFNDADTIILLDIYSAREKDTGIVSSQDLANKMSALGKDVLYFNSFQDAESFLQKKCKSNDIIITMGAGDVYLIGESILK